VCCDNGRWMEVALVLDQWCTLAVVMFWFKLHCQLQRLCNVGYLLIMIKECWC